MNNINLTNLTLPQLTNYFSSLNQPAFRAAQVFDWVHHKGATSFGNMTNLSKELRQSLEKSASLTVLTLKNQQISALDGTTKYLFSLADGNAIESVLMPYKHGNSLCISTQVGCKMGCTFCASTIGGLVRSLTAGEIAAQVYTAEKLSGEKISNVVLMGIGEPMDNFDNVIDFINIVTHPKGRGLSTRNITLSTCGLVPGIKNLADLHLPITLAVSLHAANNDSRSKIMPVNHKYNIADLLEACRYYFSQTGRRLTFEYALIDGVNDSPKDADNLSRLLKGLNCHINLIPVNTVRENSYKKSSTKSIEAFKAILIKKGYAATIRRELGSDISAACGQLRREDNLTVNN